jgi:hypothetical protein
MSESWQITENGTIMIRQNSTFNLEKLYKLYHTFALENKFLFHENNFTRKDKSDGHEFQIEWRLERKTTDFIKSKIIVEIWSQRTTKIDHNNYKGEIEINIDSVMEMDWQNKWEKNKFTKFLRHIYIFYLKKQYFNNYAGRLWEEIYELQARTKEILHQFTP